MLCSHPLHVSLLPVAMQPEGIRREKTQNSLICTKGKALIYCCPERNWKEGWSLHFFLHCSLKLSLPFSPELPKWQLVCYSSIPCHEVPVWSGARHLGSVCAAVNSAQMLKEDCYEAIKGTQPSCAKSVLHFGHSCWLLSSVPRITPACSFPLLVGMGEGM